MRSLNLILALPTFPGRLQPSIIGALDFTSVFEMGTGVSPKLYTPEIFQSSKTILIKMQFVKMYKIVLCK